jgi:hypothetical protein
MSEIEELRAQLRLLGRMFSEFVSRQPSLPEGCAEQPKLHDCYLEALKEEIAARLSTHPSLVGCSVLVYITRHDCRVVVYLPPYGVQPSQAGIKALQEWTVHEFAICANLVQNMTGVDLSFEPAARKVDFSFVSAAAAHKQPGRKKK